MRAVFQRVLEASVRVNGEALASIEAGALVFVGVREGDTDADARWLAHRIAHLRVFEDGEGKMNHSLLDSSLPCIVVSQFTLYGDCNKGRRPSFVRACTPPEAERLYERVVQELEALGISCQTGRFGADMKVALINDGPVTLLFDSEKTF